MDIENFWLFDRKFSVGLQFVILLCVIRQRLAEKPLAIILIMILIMIRMISNGGRSMRFENKITEFKRVHGGSEIHCG